MTQYSQTIKNLVAGISQQPPILRLPEQLDDQINGFSTEAGGLQKRPPTLHVKSLADISLSDTSEPLVHFVNRDANERYIMMFYDNSIKIVDIAGNSKTVTIAEDADYLKTTVPREDLRVLTVADYTFIVNRTKTVRMTGTTSPDYFTSQGALIHVKQGQYGRTYIIYVDGKQISTYTSPDGSNATDTQKIDTAYIRSQLANGCRSSGYTVDEGDAWLRIRGNFSGGNISTQDGFNNNAMIAITTTVQRFSLLPSTAPSDYVVKVKGDPNGSDDSGSYYVKYNGTDKVWEECCCPNILTNIDASTMPHALIRQTDGSFKFQRCNWTERKVGDDDSNPNPSFIDATLNDIFFFRNRLGVLSGENVIMSESAEYFNMWMTTANDILDTDCIDIPATTSKINILKYAVDFNEDLYLFSNDAQFLLSVDTVLSPKNCALVETTEFRSSPDCKPVVAGKNMYFATERAEYTTIKEYFNVESVNNIRNAQDITSHIPSYIPNGVYQTIVATDENILFFLTTGDLDSIYIYKYLFVDDNRVQAAWSKWDFEGHIYGSFFIDSTLYLLIKRGSMLTLEKSKFTYKTKDYTEEPYRAYIDRKIITAAGVYDSVYERTSFNLKTIYNTTDLSDIKTVDFIAPDGQLLTIEAADIASDGTFSVSGNYSNKNIVLGIPYEFKAVLSTIYVKKQDSSGGTQALLNGRLQLHELSINYDSTGYFKVTVKHTSGKTYWTDIIKA
ncbi:hypothetical protein, partial [Pectinatus frisingensis]|uniref:phage nozzle protein n=1 Tax=Pectinatus frisingensis TaxID=865 RepID=UPI0018C45DFA